MKKSLSLLMALLLGCVLMGATGCAEDTTPTDDPLATTEATEPTGDTTDPTEENDDPTEPTDAEPTEPDVTEPTEPMVTDPTEPEPTEPVVTEPTEPEPTEPVVTEPTEPVPTEPEPTEPVVTEPTEPEPTEPEPTESEPTEPTVRFQDVDETVYATATVNVRSGPGTEYDSVGKLYFGNSVRRTGVGDNGWSRVVFDGQVAYVYAEYLSTKNPVVNTGGTGNTGSGNEDTGNAGDNGNSGNTGGNAGGNTGGNTGSGGTTGENTSGGNAGGEDTGTTETKPVYVQDADPNTGISWDGVSPILYYYTDGTTGYEPKHLARYEVGPGVWITYVKHTEEIDQKIEDAKNGITYCSVCGKRSGTDGKDGKCARRLMVDWTCPHCGVFVPVGECHTCGD